MNEDIVDLLRISIPTEASQQPYLTWKQTVMLEAANEIVRLRESLRKARQVIEHYESPNMIGEQ